MKIVYDVGYSFHEQPSRAIDSWWVLRRCIRQHSSLVIRQHWGAVHFISGPTSSDNPAVEVDKKFVWGARSISAVGSIWVGEGRYSILKQRPWLFQCSVYRLNAQQVQGRINYMVKGMDLGVTFLQNAEGIVSP